MTDFYTIKDMLEDKKINAYSLKNILPLLGDIIKIALDDYQQLQNKIEQLEKENHQLRDIVEDKK